MYFYQEKSILHEQGQYKLAVAKRTLRKQDAAMSQLIDLVGPTKVRSERELSVYQSLVRAIAYQMISTKAAAAIHGRLLEQCDDNIAPGKLLDLGAERLREIGYSRAKVASLLDLSEKCRSGEVPSDNILRSLPDTELIECLTTVRGIGAWSVEMLMIFNMRRADVFPATDLGVRRGHMLAYNLDDMLSAGELRKQAAAWQPYRSVAAWYLWRANDCVDWAIVRPTKKKPSVTQAKKKPPAKRAKKKSKKKSTGRKSISNKSAGRGI